MSIAQDQPGGPVPQYLAEAELRAAVWAREAGRLLSERFGRPLAVEYKDAQRSDPVTPADRDAQQLIADRVALEFPDHGFVGEEKDARDAVESPQVAPDYVWVVDPLDGTKNFVGGMPVYASSIGLLYRGKPVVGAVWVPWPGKPDGLVLHARLGGGAFADGERLGVFSGAGPEPTRLMTLPGAFAWTFHMEPGLARRAGEYRNTGSIVYDLAMTARGTLQYTVTIGPRLWDVVAGAVLVTEAGGSAWMQSRGRQGGGDRPEKTEWGLLDSFVPWKPGETTLQELRAWSSPVVFGGPGAARAVVRGLERKRVGWREQARHAAGWMVRG